MSISNASYAANFASLFGRGGVPQKLGLAVSGGVDSMALAFLTRRLVLNDTNYHHLTTFTIDHQARENSNQEAHRVKDNLTSLGFNDCHVLNMDWSSSKYDISSTKFELEARHKRLKLFHEACEDHGISHLLFAHTLDDQLETLLMRLVKGSSINGLAGIQPVNRSPLLLPPTYPKLTFVRPLLQFSKSQLHDTCVENSVPWIEDPTNFDPEFTQRNAVRHLLSKPEQLPKALTPENLESSLYKIQENCKEIESDTKQELRQLIQDDSISIDPDLGTAKVRIPNKNVSTSVRSSILFKAVERIMPYSNPSYKFSSIDSTVREKLSDNHQNIKEHDVANLAIHRTSLADNGEEYLITRQNPYKKELPKITERFDLPDNAEWTDWKLFDGRFWFRFKVTNGSSPTLTLSLDDSPGSVMTFLETDDPTAEDPPQEPLDFSDWPPKSIVKLLPVISDQDGTMLGYPTLNKYNPICTDWLKVEYALKSVGEDEIPIKSHINYF